MMRRLSAKDILTIWECAQGLHPVDQALVILTVAMPERARDELAAFSIGRRDGLLLDAREQIFGPSLQAFANCPQCSAPLEFAALVSELRAGSESEIDRKEFELREAGYRLRFRLPDSKDLAAIAGCASISAARTTLAERCLSQASFEGATISFDKLTEKVIEKLATRISECDPQSDVSINLECPACGNKWALIFDIASFLMAEINSLAKRLMREVHALSLAYGWRESDILEMSARRREFYMVMVS